MKNVVPAAVGAALIVGAVGLGFAPAAEVPAPSVGEHRGLIERLCPTFQQAQMAQRVGAVGASVRRAPVADRAQGQDVKSPTVVNAATAFERWSADVTSPFAAVVGATAATGPERGLSVVECPVPRSEQWFGGVRSGANATATLELTNLDNTDAEVNVILHATTGVVAAPGARGIVVPARGTRAVPLSPLASLADPLGIEVRAVSGRVAADLRVRQWAQTAPLGADWVPRAAEAAEQVVVPGIPAGERLLVVTNPSDRTADVDIELLTPSGPIRAAGAESVTVPAASTRVVKLGAGTGTDAVSARLSSNVPIVAAAEVTTSGDANTRDWAVVGAGKMLGVRAVAQLPAPGASETRIVLTNPGDETAKAHVTGTLAGAKKLDRDVEIPAASTVVLDPVKGADPLIEVTSDADVYATAVVTAAIGPVQGVAVLPLTDSTVAGAAVPITHDPRVGG